MSMTKAQVYATVAAVLSALLAVHPEVAPESSIYLAMDMDIHKYEAIRDLLVSSGLVTVKHNALTLTEKGVATARECEAAIAK